MPELRWILLAVGVLIVALVYILGRRGEAGRAQRMEPRLGGEVDPPGAAKVRRPEPEITAARVNEDSPVGPIETKYRLPEQAQAPSAAPAGENKIVTIRVTGRDNERWSGSLIFKTLREEGLRFGERNIFHRMGRQEDVKFSVANLIEPGEFDPARLEQLQTPGVIFFAQLSTEHNGAEVFDDMLQTAQKVARRLGGTMLDDNGSTLTRQTAHHLRESIIEFEHRARHSVG